MTDIAALLVKDLEPVDSMHTFSAGEDLAALGRKNGHFFQLKEGSLTVTVKGRQLQTIVEGELVGLAALRWDGQEVISSGFAVRATVYDYELFIKSLGANPERAALYIKYLERELRAASIIAVELSGGEVVIDPTLLYFEPGQVIIEQGSKSGEVYNLIEGQARAYVDGVKVGEVLEEEIFGMLTAVSGAPRNASVIAETRCVVARIKPDEFVDYLKSKPHAVFKTIQDMARLITDLNKQVVEAQLTTADKLKHL